MGGKVGLAGEGGNDRCIEVASDMGGGRWLADSGYGSLFASLFFVYVLVLNSIDGLVVGVGLEV